MQCRLQAQTMAMDDGPLVVQWPVLNLRCYGQRVIIWWNRSHVYVWRNTPNPRGVNWHRHLDTDKAVCCLLLGGPWGVVPRHFNFKYYHLYVRGLSYKFEYQTTIKTYQGTLETLARL